MSYVPGSVTHRRSRKNTICKCWMVTLNRARAEKKRRHRIRHSTRRDRLVKSGKCWEPENRISRFYRMISHLTEPYIILTTPKGSRTPVLWLRTRYPRPLDDGGVGPKQAGDYAAGLGAGQVIPWFDLQSEAGFARLGVRWRVAGAETVEVGSHRLWPMKLTTTKKTPATK